MISFQVSAGISELNAASANPAPDPEQHANRRDPGKRLEKRLKPKRRIRGEGQSVDAR